MIYEDLEVENMENNTGKKMPTGKLCGYVCKDCANMDLTDKGARESYMCLHYKSYTLAEDSIASVCRYFIRR